MDRRHFAYGAAMDRLRLPAASRALGPAALADVALAFTGELVLRSRLGQAVTGILYDLPADAVVSERWHACTAIHPDGTYTAAVASGALDPSDGGFIAPSASDLLAARHWRQTHGLDTAMLDQAAEGVAPAPAIAALFIYGTLLPGEERGHILPQLGLTAASHPATVPGRLLDLGAYPGLVLQDDAGLVHGEIAFPGDFTAALPPLDEIEDARPRGAPGGTYRRTLVTARLADGRTLLAWTYVIDAPERHASRPIPGGSWRDRWK